MAGLESAGLTIGNRGAWCARGTTTSAHWRARPARPGRGPRVAPTERLKHELSKDPAKAGDSNACVPKEPGLGSRWDTNYPSLREVTDSLFGDYRLRNKHHEQPTV